MKIKFKQSIHYFVQNSHASDDLVVFILNGYLALLLGVQHLKSGCQSFALLIVNTLLSRSHRRCAVLYLTALLSPCIENLPKSKYQLSELVGTIQGLYEAS